MTGIRDLVSRALLRIVGATVHGGTMQRRLDPSDVRFAEESGRDPLRARSGGDRRGHRSPRHHHLRQRQVLRDLAVLARRADRSGPSHRELRLPPQGVHARAVADHRARQRLARRDPQPREGRILLLGRHDHRAVPRRAAASRASTSRFATTSPRARTPRRSSGSRRPWRSSASSPPWSRTKCATRWPACARRCRSSIGACPSRAIAARLRP